MRTLIARSVRFVTRHNTEGVFVMVGVDVSVGVLLGVKVGVMVGVWVGV